MVRVLLLLLFSLLAPATLAEPRTLTLVADDWCPFNCADKGSDSGILLEIASAALATQGYRVEYLELPWSRAIAEVRLGHYDGLVGVGREETPDFHFPAIPLATARHSFYTLPESAWRFGDLVTLTGVRLGVIQNYSYGGLYDDYIKPNRGDDSRLRVLKGTRALPRLVGLLRLKRIDALIAEERVLDHHFQSRGQTNPLRHAGLGYEEGLFIAFSPALEDGQQLAEALGRGLESLEHSGRLKKLQENRPPDLLGHHPQPVSTSQYGNPVVIRPTSFAATLDPTVGIASAFVSRRRTEGGR